MHVTFGDIASARQSEQVAYRLPPSCKAYRKRAFVCSCFVRRSSLLSLGAMFIKRVGRQLYDLGVEWQGWVRLVLQDQTYLPCIGTLFYLPRHNGAPRVAPRRGQDNFMCVLFIGLFLSYYFVFSELNGFVDFSLYALLDAIFFELCDKGCEQKRRI